MMMRWCEIAKVFLIFLYIRRKVIYTFVHMYVDTKLIFIFGLLACVGGWRKKNNKNYTRVIKFKQYGKFLLATRKYVRKTAATFNSDIRQTNMDLSFVSVRQLCATQRKQVTSESCGSCASFFFLKACRISSKLFSILFWGGNMGCAVVLSHDRVAIMLAKQVSQVNNRLIVNFEVFLAPSFSYLFPEVKFHSFFFCI